MNLTGRKILGIAAALAMLSLPGCISVRIKRPIKNAVAKSKQPPKMATREELAARVAKINDQIRSFQATLNMTPSTGSVYKGEITEYRDIRGYILFRDPQTIRVIGQYPVVRSTAFDMVSDGKVFKIWFPAKNLFVIGENAAPTISANKLENWRPQAFLDSMLLRPVDVKAQEKATLLDLTDEDHSFYFLLIQRNDEKGNIVPLRSIWFDRVDLQIVRQVVYSPDANIVSDTRYSNWTDFSGVSFPKTIDINRPTDGYGVVLDVVKIEMNVPLTDQQFSLQQPAGSKLQIIGSPEGVPVQPANATPRSQKMGQK
jgi:outer membrane lipoprotein-sorting protein